MSHPDDKELLNRHKRRLQKLLETKANLGVNTQPEILIEIEDIEATIEKLEEKTSFFVDGGELQRLLPIKNFVGNSDELFLSGVALNFFVKRHMHLLEKQLEEGTKFRFLMLDPRSPMIVPIATMFNRRPGRIKESIIEGLKEINSKLRDKAALTGSGSVEVRLSRSEPIPSLAIRNPRSHNGILTGGIRIYGFSSAIRPHFILNRSDNEIWFNNLVQSYENLWNDSHLWPQEKAGVVAYRPTADGKVKILLITTRYDPNKWIFPVGTVDPGETLQQTAARECLEESGCVVEVAEKLGKIKSDVDEPMTFFLSKLIEEKKSDESFRRKEWVQLSELNAKVTGDFRLIAQEAVAKLNS